MLLRDLRISASDRRQPLLGHSACLLRHTPRDHQVRVQFAYELAVTRTYSDGVGGTMVIPVGDYFQELKLLTKIEGGVEEKSIVPVRFVPMTGEAQEKK